MGMLSLYETFFANDTWQRAAHLSTPQIDKKTAAYARLKKPGVVFGQQTMNHYRSIRRLTILPSHVKPAPQLLGSASHGKLTADEWNTVCRYMLPLTLVSLWGSKPSDSREKKLLDNTMHLVAAFRLLDLRRTTQAIGESFDHHYRAYLKGILHLFPTANLKPVHHMVGHSPEFLSLFGPSRHWGAWTFEFLNGLSQMVRHNWKNGEPRCARVLIPPH